MIQETLLYLFESDLSRSQGQLTLLIHLLPVLALWYIQYWDLYKKETKALQ